MHSGAHGFNHQEFSSFQNFYDFLHSSVKKLSIYSRGYFKSLNKASTEHKVILFRARAAKEWIKNLLTMISQDWMVNFLSFECDKLFDSSLTELKVTCYEKSLHNLSPCLIQIFWFNWKRQQTFASTQIISNWNCLSY